MVLLLDCLKRRENWPEQFIAALEACDHLTLADEVRREYDALRGDNSELLCGITLIFSFFKLSVTTRKGLAPPQIPPIRMFFRKTKKNFGLMRHQRDSKSQNLWDFF